MIKNTGHSTVFTPSHHIVLKNVLHVRQATHNLASVHHFTSVNDVFLELHPSFFLIKDQQMRRTVLHGRCSNRLYPIPSLESSSIKLCFSTTKISKDEWHGRLGHPSFKVVNRVLHNNNLPFMSGNNASNVCDACQHTKSHQLPFPRSTSVSTTPLQLIFSNVWALLLARLATIIIMFPLLMILVSLHGSMRSNINLKCFKSFMIFSLMLSASLTVKLLPCKWIGEGSTTS
jgi:hypothetical protein